MTNQVQGKDEVDANTKSQYKMHVAGMRHKRNRASIIETTLEVGI